MGAGLVAYVIIITDALSTLWNSDYNGNGNGGDRRLLSSNPNDINDGILITTSANGEDAIIPSTSSSGY